MLASLGVLFADTSAAVAAEEAAPVEVSKADLPKDDYYTRRAKSILEAEKNNAEKPHPLAAGYPGMDVVVCEAGCPEGPGAHIVFLRQHVVPTESREGSMQPTSGDAALPADPGAACVAGCYDKTASAMLSQQSEPNVGEWATTIKSADLPPRDKLSPVR
jgi:hypothetical protein